ncbi:hypothetical protein [Maliponia aquimaris]|uniref:Uncharacterized protein n=1 Tax=Maliponia aquimaris TaxID=1673631 RepID=A0A238K4D5_9RHOB|nr:hypothetical protein [Maliponia aquimaris]SMX37715.1 hypothetical protein MAA8898_01238 [Maliponia aquimaris]
MAWTVFTFPLPRLLSGLLYSCLLCAGLALPATAANVTAGAEPCDFALDGPIEAGDVDKLAAFRSDPDLWRKDGRYWEPTLCLNSPGGNLAEGGKIARFVYDTGLQTRIGDGAICHSVCAIVFMMGNRHSGPTTVEQTRTLHVGGDLAFQSPSFSTDDTRHAEAPELRQAYQQGVNGILTFLRLANAQRPFETGGMIHPGLFEAMLDTPPDALFHITTIEQALSWEIGLEGVPQHLPPVATQRQMVCENGLMRGFRRPSEIFDRSDNNFMTQAVFRLRPLSTTAQYRLLPEYDPEELAQGVVYGFRYWDLPVECRVRIDSGAVAVCGRDAYHNHSVGDCEDDTLVPLPDHARYHPLTEFRALERSGIAADVLREARCTLHDGSGKVLRSDSCMQAIDIFQRGDRKFARHSLHWPDGAPGTIEISTRPTFGVDEAPDIYRVDGAEAAPKGEDGTCLRIAAQDQVICVTAP